MIHKFLITLLLVCFSSTFGIAAEKLKILANIPPYASLASSVGGDLVEVDPLITNHVGVHFFEPKHSHLQSIYEADIVLLSGLEFEQALVEKIASLPQPPEIVDLNAGLPLIMFDSVAPHSLEDEHGHEDEDDHKDEHGHEDEDDHKDEHGHEDDHKDEHGHEDDHKDEHGHEDEDGHKDEQLNQHQHQHHNLKYDVHSYSSPEMLLLQAEKIYAAILKKLPQKQQLLQRNLAELELELKNLNAEISAKLSMYKHSTVFSYHSITRYFSREFDLHEVSLSQNYALSFARLQEFKAAVIAAGAKFVIVNDSAELKQMQTLFLNSPQIAIINLPHFSLNWKTTINNIANAFKTGFDG